MQDHIFQPFINAILLLTEQQKYTLAQALSTLKIPIDDSDGFDAEELEYDHCLENQTSALKITSNTITPVSEGEIHHDITPDLEKLIELHFSQHPQCPHCESEELKRCGIQNNRQRYLCKTCKRSFNAFTGTTLARLRHPEKWSGYLQGMTHSSTLRTSAQICGINLKTSFRWRHRFLEVIDRDQADELVGIVELDETFLDESFKGQRDKLPRPARKRGSDSRKGCKKIPVMVALDRQQNTVDSILENESANELCRHLNGRINIQAIVCADASLAHEKLARDLGFIFKELVTSSEQHVLDGIYHLQHVNAYHSHLKRWIEGVFHGVATKYLTHYLGWRRMLTESVSLTVGRLSEKIAEHWCKNRLRGT